MPKEPREDDGGFGVESLFGAATREPLVKVTLGNVTEQVPPSKAREMAAMLLECAEAAEQDANVMDVCADMGMELEEQAQMLRLFRQKRQERAAKGALKEFRW